MIKRDNGQVMVDAETGRELTLDEVLDSYEKTADVLRACGESYGWRITCDEKSIRAWIRVRRNIREEARTSFAAGWHVGVVTGLAWASAVWILLILRGP